jgi:hypothetical protein
MTGVETSEVKFGTTLIAYTVRRSPRRKTVALSIDPRLGVVLVAPPDVALSRLDTVVYRRAPWIVERLRRTNRGESLPPREFVSGETFLYLGRQYRLRVVPGDDVLEVKLASGSLRVPIPSRLAGAQRAAAVRKSLESWYRLRAARRLPERVETWARRVAVSVPEVFVRDQQRRWASCDRGGVVRFNWRIIQAPMGLVDYVVAHELVHLRERGHTAEFWAFLGKVMPEYERRRDALRQIGSRLDW